MKLLQLGQPLLEFRKWLKCTRIAFVEDSHLYAHEPSVSWRLNSDNDINEIARKYMKSVKIDPTSLNIEYEPLNDKVGEQLASTYEELKHTPDSPKVRKAYESLKRETLEQFRHLLEAGYTILPDNDPTSQGGGYAGAKEMRNDVVTNKKIHVYIGGDLPVDHPLAELSPYTFGGHHFNYNELFRTVHDIFGHAHHGNHFGPRGEEHAYRLHSRMYSPLARAALATETRGQNSWIHYGPMKHIPLEERPYAQQKAAIMPDHLLGDVHSKN